MTPRLLKFLFWVHRHHVVLGKRLVDASVIIVVAGIAVGVHYWVTAPSESPPLTPGNGIRIRITGPSSISNDAALTNNMECSPPTRDLGEWPGTSRLCNTADIPQRAKTGPSGATTYILPTFPGSNHPIITSGVLTLTPKATGEKQ